MNRQHTYCLCRRVWPSCTLWCKAVPRLRCWDQLALVRLRCWRRVLLCASWRAPQCSATPSSLRLLPWPISLDPSTAWPSEQCEMTCSVFLLHELYRFSSNSRRLWRDGLVAMILKQLCKNSGQSALNLLVLDGQVRWPLSAICFEAFSTFSSCSASQNTWSWFRPWFPRKLSSNLEEGRRWNCQMVSGFSGRWARTFSEDFTKNFVFPILSKHPLSNDLFVENVLVLVADLL